MYNAYYYIEHNDKKLILKVSDYCKIVTQSLVQLSDFVIVEDITEDTLRLFKDRYELNTQHVLTEVFAKYHYFLSNILCKQNIIDISIISKFDTKKQEKFIKEYILELT